MIRKYHTFQCFKEKTFEKNMLEFVDSLNLKSNFFIFLYFSDNLFHYRKHSLASDTEKGNQNFKILNKIKKDLVSSKFIKNFKLIKSLCAKLF